MRFREVVSMGQMLRGVYRESARGGRRAQHDKARAREGVKVNPRAAPAASEPVFGQIKGIVVYFRHLEQDAHLEWSQLR